MYFVDGARSERLTLSIWPVGPHEYVQPEDKNKMQSPKRHVLKQDE
jgi:hypothetical protein